MLDPTGNEIRQLLYALKVHYFAFMMRKVYLSDSLDAL
jgi:hypothetical protein